MSPVSFSGSTKHVVGNLPDFPAVLVMRDWINRGKRCALLSIVAIDGASPRSVGAQMVVSETGRMHGYLTGGCLEGELRLVAQKVISEERNRLYRYGKDSPFIDLKLPCGSGVDIYFDQSIPDASVFEAADLLEKRQYFALQTNLDTGQSQVRVLDVSQRGKRQVNAAGQMFERLCKPALRLNLYGAGIAAVQIAAFARQAGMQVYFYTSDKLTRNAADEARIAVEPEQPMIATVVPGDHWTASVLAYHEHEKEMPLLPSILKGNDFYVAAVGSRTVADKRLAELREIGVPPEDVDRLVSQPGLIAGARSATELGVGIVAQILEHARNQSLVG